ncbi:hypothetical protein EV641_118118 [Rhodococcus sp. SMB37]|uniref:hypothetical protein n=1 Tax=Rhodococcus sp. SMB37 TaxID=2512213 RepID=UPI000B09A828|nr:hypothetical protein [Rhodococcus sp. SMB37]TCN48194.1 hypothetical protein EV641_118118 [Rhodococcus sp. SMB37]
MRKFDIDTISADGTVLDESRLARILGGRGVIRDDKGRTGCIPDLDGSIRADDPIVG